LKGILGKLKPFSDNKTTKAIDAKTHELPCSAFKAQHPCRTLNDNSLRLMSFFTEAEKSTVKTSSQSFQKPGNKLHMQKPPPGRGDKIHRTTCSG
jgi:hypothetical protein